MGELFSGWQHSGLGCGAGRSTDAITERAVQEVWGPWICTCRPLGAGMMVDEAYEWINGNRTMTNLIPQDPFATWQVRISEADAAMMQQAYWILRAHSDGIIRQKEQAEKAKEMK